MCRCRGSTVEKVGTVQDGMPDGYSQYNGLNAWHTADTDLSLVAS
jgi:hypothetical protein